MAAHKRRPLHAQMRGRGQTAIRNTLPYPRTAGTLAQCHRQRCVCMSHTYMAHTGTGSSGDNGSSTKTRPIVFLDVDGVLCCNHETRLEAAPCAELQRIAESTRAAVVLSTDWRRDPSLSSRINGCLHERRVDCIGATPQLSGSMDRVSRVRPKEIRVELRRRAGARKERAAM